jgi:predicted transcriptional regulator
MAIPKYNETESPSTGPSKFRLLFDIVHLEAWRALTPIERSVYMVIWAYWNSKSGRAFPSVETIQKKAGLCRSSVCSATKSLEGKRVIFRKRSGRRFGFKMTYILNFDVSTMRMDKRKRGRVSPSPLDKRKHMKDEKTGKFKAESMRMDGCVSPSPLDSRVSPLPLDDIVSYSSLIEIPPSAPPITGGERPESDEASSPAFVKTSPNGKTKIKKEHLEKARKILAAKEK